MAMSKSKIRYEHIFPVINGTIDNWKNVVMSNFTELHRYVSCTNSRLFPQMYWFCYAQQEIVWLDK